MQDRLEYVDRLQRDLIESQKNNTQAKAQNVENYLDGEKLKKLQKRLDDQYDAIEKSLTPDNSDKEETKD